MAESPNLMSLRGADAEAAWLLAHGLDLELSRSQRRGNSAVQTLEAVAPWIRHQMGARGLMVRLYGESQAAVWRQVHEGADEASLEAALAAHEAGTVVEGGCCCATLDVDDEVIGRLACSFETTPVLAPVLIKVAAQELDNVVYEFRRARLRHRQVIDVERKLRDPILEHTVADAAAYVRRELGAAALVVVYAETAGDDPRLTAVVCKPDGTPALVRAGDEGPLGAFLARGGELPADDLVRAVGLSGAESSSVNVETGLGGGAAGTVVACGAPSARQGAGREFLEHFAVALGQRLVDYHKDRRYLEAFFSPEITRRLLATPGYFGLHLLPRLRDVAVLFTDITSFTAISERILSGPEEVGELVDFWSQGVVQILFDHGGVFDKMVGDCVIGIFGPPFDELTAPEAAANALSAALAIRDYTGSLTGIPAIGKIRSSGLIPGLGVATGVNVGPNMVGTLGPNRDFTAFGREMNNTARLQGVATYQEVLAMKSVRDVLVASEHPLERRLVWGDVREKAVKNVKDPLQYYLVG